jgi:EAL domain-containing protein (putative c-di-GMP-specific phosphodiesterase class I)
MFLHFAPLHGFGYIIFPDAVCRWLGNHLGFIHLLLLWSAMLFSYHFLDIGRFRPRLAYGIKKSYFLFIPLIILSVFMTELQRMYVTAPLTIGVLYICIGSAIHEIKKGYYPATYYSLSWVGISLGAICGYLTYIDVIPQNIFTMHSFMIGSIAEQLLLSVSLAKRLQYQEGKIKLSHLIDQTLDMPNQNFNQQELKEQFVRSNRDPSSVRLLLIQLEGLDDVIGTLGTDIVAQENRVILQNVADAVSSLPWQIDLHLDKPYFGLCIPPHQTLVFVTNEESCKVQIEKLMAIWQQEIDESFYLSDVNIRAASADLTKGWDEISRLHQCAYMALVEARNNGEKWLPYTQSMMESSQKHITLLQDLKLAISDNDIEVYIQPQVDLSSNEVVGGEALVRWTHPRLGGVSPGVFIPLAEQSGLIYSLTQSVIRQLFSWVVNQPPTLNFSVNISALDVQQKGFVSFLQQMRDHYGVNAKNITLEITESKEMDLSHDFIGKLKAMKSLGFSLSIDDFGTGYSSLAYLSQLDIDEVKVDIMFTRDIDKNVTNQNIVKTLINMADAFQANVVIEGIETINERRMVKSLGGGIGQGFFWSGAVPMRKFEQQFSRTQCEVEVNQQQGLAYLHR